MYRPHKTYLWKGYTEDHLFATSASQPLIFVLPGPGRWPGCEMLPSVDPGTVEGRAYAVVTTRWHLLGPKFKENFFTTPLPTSSQSSLPPQSRLWTYSLNLWYGWMAEVLTTQTCPNWRKCQPHSTCFLSQYSLSFYQWQKIIILFFFLLLIQMSWDILKRITNTHTHTE